jgi:glycosyltransferase involved in cell wall biosynthesis
VKLCFVWPRPDPVAAALGPASGGYAYDEALVAALRRKGLEVAVVETRGPLQPGVVADATAVVVDGLGAAHALPALAQVRGLKVGLIHIAPADGADHQAFFDALDVALFVSESVREETRAILRLPARVAVATPGVDHFPRRARAAEARFVSVAHVLPHKGALEALEAYAVLRDARPELPWTASWLGGLEVQPSYAEEVLARLSALRLEERVTFAGRVSPERVADHLARATALLSTSVAESWGLGAAEALSLGVPLVAWTRGGVFAQASAAGAGVFVKPGDLRGLAQALAALLTDATVRARADEAARTLGASLPGWDDCARAVLSACG